MGRVWQKLGGGDVYRVNDFNFEEYTYVKMCEQLTNQMQRLAYQVGYLQEENRRLKEEKFNFSFN